LANDRRFADPGVPEDDHFARNRIHEEME
jgi:hypothetical protein